MIQIAVYISAAIQYKKLNLQINRRAFVVGRKSKIASIAKYTLTFCVGVAYFLGCATINVNTVQNSN
jgi:hypothetical protein